MSIKLYMVVDSNLRSVTIGKGCVKQRPYINCEGTVKCVYVVNNKDRELAMPTLCELKDGEYTDVLVSLGTNNVKFEAESYVPAARALIAYYRQLKENLPKIRLYYLQVPPSISKRISNNARRYNDIVEVGLKSEGVTIIQFPLKMIDIGGCLKREYAIEKETQLWIADSKRVHYSKEGKSLVMLRVKMALQRRANKKIK